MEVYIVKLDDNSHWYTYTPDSLEVLLTTIESDKFITLYRTKQDLAVNHRPLYVRGSQVLQMYLHSTI